MADAGISQRDIGQKCGVSQGHVSKMLGLLRLPEKAQEWVATGKLSQEAALTIASLPAPMQKELIAEGVPAEWQIKGARLRFEADRRIVDLTKKLEADGQTVVRVASFDAWWQPELMEKGDPVAIVVDGRYGTLAHVDDEQHASEPCAVVAIDGRGTVRDACSDPARHPAPDDNDDPNPRERAAGELAVGAVAESLLPSMRRAVEVADNAAGADLITILAFAVPIFVRSNDCYIIAERAMDFLEVPDWDRDRELEELGALAETSPVTAMLAFALQDSLATLQQIVESAVDGAPLDAIENELPDHVRDARALIDHLRAACPDDGIGTLEDIVSDFGQVDRDDQVDDDEDPTETGAGAPTPSSTDVEDAPAGDGDGADELPEITIVEGGKATARKYFRDCSACGRLPGFNTNREQAVNRGYDDHLVPEHGAEPRGDAA